MLTAPVPIYATLIPAPKNFVHCFPRKEKASERNVFSVFSFSSFSIFMDPKTPISVMMFPWLAHGHISPFLELAKKLTTQNFKIYLCSTPINLGTIKARLDEKFSLSIELVELELPSLSNLPPDFHTTNGLPPNLMFTLKKAFDMSKDNFSKILDTIKPDLLIYDLLQPWAPAAAIERNIPAVEFISSSGTMTSLEFHKVRNPLIEYPFSEAIYFRDYEIEAQSVVNVKEEGVDYEYEKNRGNHCLVLSEDIVLMKSFKELEGKYNDYLSSVVGKKIVPVGPLVKAPTQEEHNEGSDIIEWLDGKDCGSTVFASFGSEFFLSKEDLEEIAHGLEMSGVNFIWVVRFPKGDDISLEKALPEGFLKRVGERGLVMEGWAPQMRILGHPSIGGFVSHCGWNSVMESMKFGVPIIAMPMHLDQPINARLVADVGTGVEVVRNSDGRLDPKTMASTISLVVVDELGKAVREKAKQLSLDIMRKGDEEIDGVVEELKRLYLKKL